MYLDFFLAIIRLVGGVEVFEIVLLNFRGSEGVITTGDVNGSAIPMKWSIMADISSWMYAYFLGSFTS